MPAVTLDDVAKKAGVSNKTVSRVLNNEPNVSEKTLQKVKQAIEELEYVPNTFARRLSSGKAMTLGLALGWQVYSPFVSLLINVALQESNRLGYSISLFSLWDGKTDHIVQAYLGKQVDGFIVDTAAAKNEMIQRRFKELNIPYVVIHPDSKDEHPNASFIRIDDKLASKVATEYLIQLGHRSIGYISVLGVIKIHQVRIAGYRQALQEAGIPFREDYVYNKTDVFGYENGYNGAIYLLTNYKEITAIVTATDDIAMGALSAIWTMGKRIPEDLSVIGFDDALQAAVTAPPLTTVHQPIDEIACLAIKTLIDKIDHPDSKPVDIVLPTRLVVRKSTRSLL